MKKSFEKYSEKWNTKNYQDFEMETLSRSGMFLGKKKYVTDLIYEDGVHIESLSRLKIIVILFYFNRIRTYSHEAANHLLLDKSLKTWDKI